MLDSLIALAARITAKIAWADETDIDVVQRKARNKSAVFLTVDEGRDVLPILERLAAQAASRANHDQAT